LGSSTGIASKRVQCESDANDWRFAWQCLDWNSKIRCDAAGPQEATMADVDIVKARPRGRESPDLGQGEQGRLPAGGSGQPEDQDELRERGGQAHVRALLHTLQLSAHFISVIARTRIDHADVAKVEAAMREQMTKLPRH